MRKQSITLKPFIDFTCRFSFVSTKNEYRKNNVKGGMMKKPFKKIRKIKNNVSLYGAEGHNWLC